MTFLEYCDKLDVTLTPLQERAARILLCTIEDSQTMLKLFSLRGSGTTLLLTTLENYYKLGFPRVAPPNSKK